MTYRYVAAVILLFGPFYTHASITRSDVEAWLAKGEHSKALTAIDTRLKSNPDDAAWLFLKAQTLEGTDQPEQAIKVYQTLIESKPDMPQAYNNLAVLYAKQGNMKASREMLEQALKSSPIYATVFENLVAVNVEMTRDSYGKALRLGVNPRQLSLKALHLDAQSQSAVVMKKDKTKAKANPQFNTSQPAIPQPALDDPAGKRQHDEIRITLQGWATAWSAQAVDLYLSFYDQEFTPSRGMSRESWARQRKYRLRKPKWVEVKLNDIKVSAVENGRATVKLLQQYRSDSYSDQTQKEFLLKLSSNGWRILREKNIH